MKRLLVLLFALFFFSGSALSQEWVDMRSQNLRMITNGSQKQSHEALWKLEQARMVFGHLLNRSKVNRNRPTIVLALPSAEEVRTLAGNTPIVAGGFGISTPLRNYLVLDLSAPDWSGIYRDYALLLLNANYPKAQPWFDEGVAQYIAGLNIDGKQIIAGPSPQVSEELKSGLQPISQMISEQGRSSRQFAATSWVFLRWLMESGQFENVGPYFNQVMNQSVPPDNAFQQVFGLSPEAMNAALAKFRGNLMSPKALGAPEDLDLNKFVVTKLSPNDARAIEAQLKLDEPGQQEKAMATLRQLMASDPNNAEVHRGLAIASLRAGDMKNAGDHIRRAIEIHDDNALMHYLLAVWHNRGSMDAMQVDSEVPTIMLQSQKAIDLDPEMSYAYRMLAETELATGHPDRATATIRKGMALSPRSDDMLLAFASVQIANSKFDDARALLKFLQTSDDRQVAERAKEMLGRATRMRKADQNLAEQRARYTDPTDPRWKPKEDDTKKTTATSESDSEPTEAKPDTRKTEYLKGMLVSVQCPNDRGAELTVVANRKTWKLDVANRSNVLLIGADTFECSWKNKSVSINYKASGEDKGDVVSLEID